MSEDVLLDEILRGQALGGLMEPEDMAGVYMFLASPYAANITGQTIGADRGEMPW
jgi:NAD(P)-dependent dehydrogenase (short-subunit alcohol dehydrogenase family)